MEPRIQYAQTADGVSIAYWTIGEGTPLVYMPHPPISHIQLEWQMPQRRAWYERLAKKRKLVRYDSRGSGLSDRTVAEYSLDVLVQDLEAVVDRLSLRKFALLGPHHAGPVAIAYAAHHSERVSHLILWCTYSRGSDYSPPREVQAARTLMDKDWVTYTETVAHAALGWAGSEMARRFAALRRESTTPEVAQAAYDAFREFDVTSLLPQVRSPTLVLHVRQYESLGLHVPRGLASGIPDARLALLEGTLGVPYLEDTEAVLTAIDEFLGEGEEVAAAAAPSAPSGLVTILFTDMEGSTTLTQRLGDAEAQEVLRTHNTIVRDALKAHSGSEIKHTGDGIMASFASASRALECAIAMQRTFEAHNEAAAARPSTGSGRAEVIRVRIGLNAGEPIAEEKDLFGTAVQLAARICAHAEPGQILASNVVQELAAGKSFVFAGKGEATLKGFEKPVRLYEVRWREA